MKECFPTCDLVSSMEVILQQASGWLQLSLQNILVLQLWNLVYRTCLKRNIHQSQATASMYFVSSLFIWASGGSLVIDLCCDGHYPTHISHEWWIISAKNNNVYTFRCQQALSYHPSGDYACDRQLDWWMPVCSRLLWVDHTISATSNSVHVYVVWHIAYSMRNDFGCQAMFHLFVKRLPAFIFLWTPLQQQGRVLLIWMTPATFDLHLALTIKHRSILCKVVANARIRIAFSAFCKYAGFGYTSVCCR